LKKLLFIALIFSFVSAALAGTIRKIKFPGMRAFSSSELESFLGISRGDSLDLNDLPRHLRNLEDSLVANDYLLARVDSTKFDTLRRNRVDLSVYVSLGNLARVGEVHWQGDSLSVSPRIARTARIQSGAVFRWASLQEDIAAILEDMGNYGFPFTRVIILDVTPQMREASEVDVTLRIQKGQAVKVSFLRFEGNRLTKPQVLERETRLRLGALYSEASARRARHYLQKLPYISSAETPDIVFDEQGRTGLAFRVAEAPSTRIDLVAGYLPSHTQGEKGTLTGLVDLSLLNLMGTGRRALVHWDRPNRTVQTIRLEYEEPWVAKLPLSIMAAFEQRIEDTIYVERQVSGRATAALTETVQLWARGRFHELIPDSASRVSLGLPATRTRGLDAGFVWDTRDWPANPRSGALFSTFAGVAWRKSETAVTGEKNHYRHNSAGLDAEVAVEVFPRWIADMAFHGKMLESNEPEILLPDLYRLGGARSLRGYREEQFFGSRIGWTNLELRYWLGKSSRFFGFVDGGAYFRERLEGDHLVTSQDFKLGTGVGVRIETGIGIWGVDYALGEEDRPLSGKIHLSLRSEF
jgi:outer membrane protein insertion porin family